MHHTQQPGLVVRHLKVLVCELGAVDTLTPRPVAIDKVSSLDHEVRDHAAYHLEVSGRAARRGRARNKPVKDAVLVPNRQAVLPELARAELSKVFCCPVHPSTVSRIGGRRGGEGALGTDVVEQFHLDSTGGGLADRDVEEANWAGHGGLGRRVKEGGRIEGEGDSERVQMR